MTKNAANTTGVRIRLRLPICSMNALLKTFSGTVSVSAGEFANVSSIALMTASLRAGSLVRTAMKPMKSPPKDCVSLK